MALLRLTFILSLTFSSLSFAQEWSRFRGPNGSGKGNIKNFPVMISAMDYRWAVKVRGQGHSSPVVWGEKIFVTVVEAKQRTVLCYNSKNGELLWKWNDPVQDHNLHKFNNFASSTPTVDQDRVYLVWGSGQKTQALALSHSGSVIWRQEWEGFISDHGQGTSPILAEGVLVFHTDSASNYKSHVMGLNPETGELLWQIERISPPTDKKHFTAYNTPVTIKSGGIETVVALQSNDGWKGVNPTDGSVVWDAPGGYKFRSVGSVVATDNYLFASFGSGGGGKVGTMLELKDGITTTVYSLGIKDGLSYVPTPLIHNNLLYLWSDGGVLTCRDLVTGQQKYRERIGGNFFSSPILADDKIVCGSLNGELIVVAATDEFEILGRSRLESGVHATPAIANGCMFIRTDTHLLCVGGKN